MAVAGRVVFVARVSMSVGNNAVLHHTIAQARLVP